MSQYYSFRCVFILSLILGCVDPYIFQSHDPDHLYSTVELKKDLDVLVTTLKEAHAHPFLYIDETTFDVHSQRIRNALRPMTERTFLKTVAPLISSIRCGHTYVYPSQEALEYRNQYAKFFPIPIRILGQRLFIEDDNGVIPGGSEVLRINGRNTSDLIQDLLPYLSGDGYVLTGKLRNIEKHFGVYYHRYVAQPDTFHIRCVTPEGQERFLVLPGVSYDAYKKIRQRETEPTRFQIDEAKRVGLLRIQTFYTVAWEKHSLKPKSFLQKTFRQLKEQNIHNLIIDIRGNEGGSVYLAADLFAYFADEDVRWCREYRLSPTTRFTYKRSIQRDSFVTFKRLVTRPCGDHRVYTWYRLLREKEMKNDCHFPGRVFLLIDGRTFSATSMFASMATTCPRVVTVGEETGGAACGNGVSPITVVLPHTQIRIDLPFGYIALNHKDRDLSGRGVIPHYQIGATPEDLIVKGDPGLSLAMCLATQAKIVR